MKATTNEKAKPPRKPRPRKPGQTPRPLTEAEQKKYDDALELLKKFHKID